MPGHSPLVLHTTIPPSGRCAQSSLARQGPPSDAEDANDAAPANATWQAAPPGPPWLWKRPQLPRAWAATSAWSQAETTGSLAQLGELSRATPLARSTASQLESSCWQLWANAQ